MFQQPFEESRNSVEDTKTHRIGNYSNSLREYRPSKPKADQDLNHYCVPNKNGKLKETKNYKKWNIQTRYTKSPYEADELSDGKTKLIISA